MEGTRVLIVEDEVIVAQSIVSMVEKMGFESIGTAMRATKALEMARLHKPDIALLDIKLKGEETGIWLAERLKSELNIPFIYLTSHGDKRTVEEATSTTPYGYVLKPVDETSLFVTIKTAMSRFEAEQIEHSEQPKMMEPEVVKESIFVKDEYQYVKISLSDITYIKSDGNYIEIHDGQKRVLKETLKNILSKLDDSRFIQVHRSYVINIEKIDKIGSAMVFLGGVEIPLSKNKKDDLLKLFNTLH